jgi:hypothetical protein
MIKGHLFGFTLCFVIILLFAVGIPVNSSDTKGAVSIERIAPEEARKKVQAREALLVCSYDDEKCKDVLLEGGILRSEFEGKVSSLSKDQEIIFYCA